MMKDTIALSYQESKKRVYDKLNEKLAYEEDQPEWVILEDKTLPKSYGWIFFFESREIDNPQDRKHIWYGSSPLIFNKFTRELKATTQDYEHYIDAYEEQLFGTTDRWRLIFPEGMGKKGKLHLLEAIKSITEFTTAEIFEMIKMVAEKGLTGRKWELEYFQGKLKEKGIEAVLERNENAS